MNDKVINAPEKTITSLAFSPSLCTQFLAAGCLEGVSCWKIYQDGNIRNSIHKPGMLVLDVAWHTDGTKLFLAGFDKQLKMWDLESNQLVDLGVFHEGPIKTCHWFSTPKSPQCTFLMTGSWDKTLKLWDIRNPEPVYNFTLPERCNCADVDYPFIVVGTVSRQVNVYDLNDCKVIPKESPLESQSTCVTIFRDASSNSMGYALGSSNGRAAIQYLSPPTKTESTKHNFTFSGVGNPNDAMYAVNDIAFHPVDGTLATAGGNGVFHFWNKETRNRIMSSEVMEKPIMRCAFNNDGNLFAYAVSNDWRCDFGNPQRQNHIFLKTWNTS